MTDLTRPDHDPDTDTTVTPTSSAAAPGAVVGPEDHEPAMAVPTVPVGEAPATPAPRRSRARWFAALGLVALVVAGSAAAALMLTGASPSATVTGYVPADSVMYGEVRLDLPGDQERAVGEFLSNFPGFADQAALDTKLDQVLDQLVSDATDGEQTFTSDIEPWFDGEMAFAVGPLPASADLTKPESAAADSRALLLLSIKDVALATAWFDGVMTESGVSGTAETYGDVEMTVFADPDMPGAQAAFAIIDGKVAVAGDLTSVKAAIDTNGTSGLAGDPGFDAAADALEGDHLGFMYVDLEALTASALGLARSSGDVPAVSDAMLALVPDWAAFQLRLESDAVVMDGAMPRNEDAPGPDADSPNEVPAWAPPTTVVLAAANDYGSTLQETIDLVRDDPSLKDALEGVEQAAGVVGGLDAALGWMGDAGLVISHDGDDLEGGLVVIPTDADGAAGARQLLTTLRSFATLGGGQGIKVSDEEYAGTTITIIDLGSAKDLVGMAGALGGPGVPTDPSSMPLPEGNVQIAYAATDDVVVVGSGPDFVKSVLDAGAGASLADDARYQDLVKQVGSDHTAVTFMDVTAIRGLLEARLSEASAEDRAEYEESMKPFLTPLDAIVGTSSIDGDLNEQHVIVTVR